MIDDFKKFIPKQLFMRSGSVFYSGRNAFREENPLYILGLNPGGNPQLQAQETIEWHTEEVMKRAPDNWSAYRDESWHGATPGTWTMQPRVIHLLHMLRLSPDCIPASNVVFTRTAGWADLAPDFLSLANLCWDFHAAVISKLKPRTILCFGRHAGNYVCKRLNAYNLRNEFIECNGRNWVSKSYDSPQGIVVIVATHPSVADWRNPTADPTALVREAINRNI